MKNVETIVKEMSHSLNLIVNNANKNFYGPYESSSVKKLLQNINELSFDARNRNEAIYNDLQWIHKSIFYSMNMINSFFVGRLSAILSFYDYTIENTLWKHIHKQVIKQSKTQFINGHYAPSVESALKELAITVRKFREDNGYQEIISERDMMRNTFSKDEPKLQFNDLSNTTNKNIQEGYSKIFDGVMQALRNPSAHSNIEMSESDAMRKLMLISDLFYKIDEALAIHSATPKTIV